MYLSLYWKGSKMVTQGFTVRGSWRPNRTGIYWPPLLWPSALCLSFSPVLLNRRFGGSAFWWVLAFSTTSCHQRVFKLTGGPAGPFCRVVAFSTTSCLQLTHFLSSPSYIIVQSPAQSLEWHVWSSSSENKCHAVHRSLSSGASVFECTMGFLPCPIFSTKPAYAISSHNCQCVTSFRCMTLEWYVWPGRRSIYNNTLTLNKRK